MLEYKADDVKSLIRRAQAYEACERYKLALQVRRVAEEGRGGLMCKNWKDPSSSCLTTDNHLAYRLYVYTI